MHWLWPKGQKVKVTRLWKLSWLTVASDYNRRPVTLRPLPAWVYMSIRLPTFSICTISFTFALFKCNKIHPFNSLFQDNLGKPAAERSTILAFNKARDDGWHQLVRMQIICTSFQTDNMLSFNYCRLVALSDAEPTVSNHWREGNRCWTVDSLTPALSLEGVDINTDIRNIFSHVHRQNILNFIFKSQFLWSAIISRKKSYTNYTYSSTLKACCDPKCVESAVKL